MDGCVSVYSRGVVSRIAVSRASSTVLQNGVTPLMLACLHGHFDMVHVLLWAGANVSAVNNVSAAQQVYLFYSTVVMGESYGALYPLSLSPPPPPPLPPPLSLSVSLSLASLPLLCSKLRRR